jgi:NADH-quinone oxidoreductase subunit C
VSVVAGQEWADQVSRALAASSIAGELSDAFGQLTVDVPPESWVPAMHLARDELGCGYFDWLSAVDELDDGLRVVAHVYDPEARRGLLLRSQVRGEAPSLATATSVYRGAAWHERETREMFGLDFSGHPHLVPLLLPPGFDGHPLLKSFVLTARASKSWPGAKDPGEAEGAGSPGRRKTLPPGVPEPSWGPRRAGGGD